MPDVFLVVIFGRVKMGKRHYLGYNLTTVFFCRC